MSDDTSASGFGKFVPGFDFLQSLAKGAAQSVPQMPGLGGWVAPTLNVEELDKRITELKAVQFWLDQNAMALKATIQALEVQKMTLATLKGMNVSMAEVAKAFTPQAAAAPATAPATAPAPAPKPEPAAAEAQGAEAAAPGVVDPMQWWGALTQQFQQIASAAVKNAAERSATVSGAAATTRSKPTASGRGASAKAAVGKAAKPTPAKKSPARKRAS
jgi:hypothetical protein